MYFKRLEVFGFKSFADKTVMNFGPGITAIVGPNGCGKSNVFDAIRWVLGEQSVKELRGAAMEDVIFNGTDKKPSLGFAEVSLTFSNESRILPVEYNEVTVTRRLFRSGESEYLLNKTPVRLKDVVELFMGTGIGAEAYSLVQQGKVDLVVSAKPEDRRIILDEASGITKYKAKRREALNRLRDTEGNLLRINDIVVEVKRQISSLERQASKARRFKEEIENLKKMEVQFAEIQLKEFSRQRQEIQNRIEEGKAKETRLTEELRELNDLIEHESVFLEEIEDKIGEVTADEIKIDGQIDINKRQIDFNEERIENIHNGQKRMAEQKGQLTERKNIQQQKMQELHNSLATLDVTIAQKIEQLNFKKQELDGINKLVHDTKAGIFSEEEKILTLSAKQVHVRNSLTEAMKEIQGCLARNRRLEMENHKVQQEKEGVDNKLNEICRKIHGATEEVQVLRSELDTKNTSLTNIREQLSSVQATIDDLEKKKLFLISQKEFIEKLRVQYQDIPDPIVTGRLITDNSPLEHHSGIIGKVKGVSLLDEARRNGLGLPPLPEGKAFYEIICETKFIELDPQQISAKIEELSSIINEQTALKEDLVARMKGQESVVDQIMIRLQEAEKMLSIYEAQKNDVVGETNKLTEELDLVRIELEEVSGSLADLKRQEGDLTVELDTLSQEMNLCQLKIQDGQKTLGEGSQRRENTTIEIAQLQSEISAEEEKKGSFAENLRIYAEALENCQQEICRIEAEEQEQSARLTQYDEQILLLEQKIEELKEQKNSLQSTLTSHMRQREEVEQRMNSVRTNVTTYSSDIESIRNTIHQEQFHDQEFIFKDKEIRDRLRQEYKIDFDAYRDSLRASVGEEVAAPGVLDPQELETAIDRLRKRCEAFGSVNLIAIEEFEELRQRFEFLTKQQSDLLEAKHSLHQTINNINRQTRQMFMDTFTKVSEEFRIYFRMLFGGGEAQLVLLDPENVLESGIEIIARPPGKKLQNISLLSGGEKTLTAIALIFGVFKVNPSPFCVLDEIDAALDESNVGRFSYLLKDFAKIAQFIVITHNKKTIAAAQVMYGITMQETGVSRIVSVKFSNDNEENFAVEGAPAGVA